MSETNWLWLGAIGMIVGSTVLFLMGGRRTQDEEGHTMLHGLVPLFAAIAYLAMALHEGGITLPSGRYFLFGRYLDWSVTTPSLLLGLSMTALHGAHRRAGLVAGLLVSDVVMIVTGLFFGGAEDPFSKWIWYITSCVAFLAVLYVMFGPLREEAMSRDQTRANAYKLNVSVLTVLWLLYPVFVLLGPDGLGYWSALVTTALIVILDFTAKVGYGLLSMVGSKKITTEDMTRGEVTAAEVTTHSVPSGPLQVSRAA